MRNGLADGQQVVFSARPDDRTNYPFLSELYLYERTEGRLTRLTDIDVRPRAIMLNRALPPAWADAALTPVTGIDDPAIRAELTLNLANWGGEARRQAMAMEGLADRYAVPLIPVPWVAKPPTDSRSLQSLLKEVDLGALGLSSSAISDRDI